MVYIFSDVFDWAFMEEGSWKTKADDIKRYWDSRIPLADYDGLYRLPEVLVFNVIPEDRLFLYGERNVHEIRREIEQRKRSMFSTT